MTLFFLSASTASPLSPANPSYPSKTSGAFVIAMRSSNKADSQDDNKKGNTQDMINSLTASNIFHLFFSVLVHPFLASTDMRKRSYQGILYCDCNAFE